ncbi:DUF6447 family protein, partial [Shimia sp.]|uniref:DUF6447 family protein n=1 Tax=Shimia sp. TaxID=1954381 RepID=UPI0025D42239
TMTDEARTVTIDDVEYPLEALSETARAQLNNLTAVDEEIARLQAQLAIAHTARAAYASVLKSELPKES